MSTELPKARESITPLELFEISKSKAIRLIDVRTPDEYSRIHAVGAVNVPMELLESSKIDADSAEPIYIVCRAGGRTETACERLHELGYKGRIIAVTGGTLAWRDAGLPVFRQRKRMSLRSRFLIVCGILGALSIILSITVHRGLLGIIGFVAAAFVFEEILFHYLARQNEFS
jgi:rhodanese-related sulfurtransferase